MFQLCHQSVWHGRVALVICVAQLVGCAGLGCPRIDPTGERFLIWPEEQAVADPFAANLQAPPVYTDSVFPTPDPTVSPVAATAVPGVAPPVPQDTLQLTPERVLAPVGSEVVLKAGLCTRENFLLTESKIEWLIERDDVGSWVALGGRGLLREPWLPWNKSEKIDNQYAVGYTAKVPRTITRGTAEPWDDVQVQPGEAWASLTASVEGTTHVTAVAPEIETWAYRRAQATIHWVDVQWTFPPAQVTASDSQVLQTCVRRQSDGTPLAGWLVRYEVAQADGEQVVEAITDEQGRASIDVTPTSSEGATSQINMQLVRPAGFGGSDDPELVVATGSTQIAWSDADPYLPPPDDLGDSLPTYQPPEPAETPRNQPTQPSQPTMRRPVLDLQVSTSNSSPQVDSEVRFELILTNQGDGPARNIVITDSLGEGFTHLVGAREIRKPLSRVLQPGESTSEFITLSVTASGRLCHDITVTYQDGAPVERRVCVDAVPAPPQREANFEVIKDGPRQRSVHETALFRTAIRNTGEVPLTNIQIVDEYDRGLLPRPSTPGYEVINDRIVWTIERLDVGATRTFEVECECVAPNDEACGRVQVTADTGAAEDSIVKAARKCVEIVQGPPDVVPRVRDPDVVPEGSPGGVTPEVTRESADALQMEISPQFRNPVRAGTSITVQIVVANSSASTKQQVQLRVTFPPELTPNVPAIQGPPRVQASFNNGQLLFTPVAGLRAAEKASFTIPVRATRSGRRDIVAEVIAADMPTPIQATTEVDIIDR